MYQAQFLAEQQANLITVPGWSNSILDDFTSAQNKAFWTKLFDDLRGKDYLLPSIGDFLGHQKFSERTHLGAYSIKIDDIVGSLGQSSSFDRNFMPTHNHLKSRWVYINYAYYRGLPLPPIDVAKVGDRYFVSDGHHRVSVAKFHKQAKIDAHVTELHLT